MAAKQITKTEYARLRRNDYAGTVRTLEASTIYAMTAANPDWRGKHWAMWFEGRGHGTTLGPVNVVPD